MTLQSGDSQPKLIVAFMAAWHHPIVAYYTHLKSHGVVSTSCYACWGGDNSSLLLLYHGRPGLCPEPAQRGRCHLGGAWPCCEGPPHLLGRPSGCEWPPPSRPPAAAALTGLVPSPAPSHTAIGPGRGFLVLCGWESIHYKNAARSHKSETFHSVSWTNCYVDASLLSALTLY